MAHLIIQWMVFATVISLLHASQSDCPVSCMCLGEFVQCDNLSEDATFPSGTETILIERANIKELHVSHFAGLESLKVIEIRDNSHISIINSKVFSNFKHLDGIFISETNIGLIKSNAFYNLSNLQTLDVHHSNISKIESKAFNNLSQISRIELASNNITSISSFAFSNVTEIKSFELFLNEIKEIQTGAFQNVLCQRINFYLNTIYGLHCNTIETLFTVCNETQFYSNNFKCDCDINWMKGVDELQPYLSNNVCFDGTNLAKFYKTDAVASCGPAIDCGESSVPTTKVTHSQSYTKSRTSTESTVISTHMPVTNLNIDTTESQQTKTPNGSSSGIASVTISMGTSESLGSSIETTKSGSGFTRQNQQRSTQGTTPMPKISRKFMPNVQDGGSVNSSRRLEIVSVYLLLLPVGILSLFS